MPIDLLIRDGDPWWASPDIWVIPGSDPNGPPGVPVIDAESYIWARIRNTGDRLAEDVEIRFYWSNPATGVLRSNSQLIGRSFATLASGGTVDVLCLTPWFPLGVNNAHECLVVELIHDGDPLTQPIPDAFNPPDSEQIAQKNINLLEATQGTMISLPIVLAGDLRLEQEFRIELVRHDRELTDELRESFGLRDLTLGAGHLVAGLSTSPAMGCDADRQDIEQIISTRSGPGENARTVFLHLDMSDCELSPDAYEWFSVVQFNAADEGGPPVGGHSYIVKGGDRHD